MFQDFYKRYKSTELQQLDVGVAGSNYPDKVHLDAAILFYGNATTINQTTE